MCLACEQDTIWLSYLESRGLVNPDDPAALEAFFSGFPVRELPFRSEPAPDETADGAAKDAVNPFSCDDPTVG